MTVDITCWPRLKVNAVKASVAKASAVKPKIPKVNAVKASVVKPKTPKESAVKVSAVKVSAAALPESAFISLAIGSDR